MREREGTQHPIKRITKLTDQRTFLLMYAEGRTNTLNRIGVAPDVQVRVDPTAPLTEIHEKVLVPARRIQVAKEVVNRSLTKISTEIHDIADKLEKAAPVFVAGVEQGREELDELAGYVEVGLVSPEVLEKMTGEYDDFTGLPDKHPPLRRGLDLLHIHEKEVGPQKEEKDNEKNSSYELPNGKELTGDMARLVELLTEKGSLVGGSTIVRSLLAGRELSEASALAAVQQLIRDTRDELEGTGVTIVSKRGRNGGYYIATENPEGIPGDHSDSEEVPPTYQLPNEKIVEGDAALLLQTLQGSSGYSLFDALSLSNKIWPDDSSRFKHPRQRVAALIASVKGELAESGLEIVGRRGPGGGYYMREIRVSQQEVVQEMRSEAEEKDAVVVFEPAETETTPQKDPEQLRSELLSREPQVEREVGKYLLALEGRMDPRGYITVDALKDRFPHMEGFKLSIIKKNGIVELSPDHSTDSLDRANAAAILYLSAIQKEGKPLPKELQRVVPTVAKEVHEALLEQRARRNGTATSR